MYPEHPYPEAEILWMRQPGIKGIRLHAQRARTALRFIYGIKMMLGFLIALGLSNICTLRQAWVHLRKNLSVIWSLENYPQIYINC